MGFPGLSLPVLSSLFPNTKRTYQSLETPPPPPPLSFPLHSNPFPDNLTPSLSFLSDPRACEHKSGTHSRTTNLNITSLEFCPNQSVFSYTPPPLPKERGKQQHGLITPLRQHLCLVVVPFRMYHERCTRGRGGDFLTLLLLLPIINNYTQM